MARASWRVCSVRARWGRERGWAVGSQNQSHQMTGSVDQCTNKHHPGPNALPAVSSYMQYTG